jgi:hypothetical protein
MIFRIVNQIQSNKMVAKASELGNDYATFHCGHVVSKGIS